MTRPFVLVSPFGPARHPGPARRFLPVVVDHSAIACDVRTVVYHNALNAIDDQVFPYRPGYPMLCSAVYAHGRFWSVDGIGAAPPPFVETPYPPTAMVMLVGIGNDDMLLTTLDECRPVSWTQADEDGYQLGPKGSSAIITLPAVEWECKGGNA